MLVHDDENTSETASFLTIRQALEGLDQGRYWLPHFQRGGVWSDEMGLRLLDSLFQGIPCGSVVIWTPPTNDDKRPDMETWGVPITSTNRSDVEFLVDGQQRLRALHQYRSAFARADMTEEHGSVWVFLPNTRLFKADRAFADRRRKRHGVFFWVSEPDHMDRGQKKDNVARERKKDWTGLALPASALIEFAGLGRHAAERKAREFDSIYGIDVSLTTKLSVLADSLVEIGTRLRNMLDSAGFFRAVLSDVEFSDSVDTYNRINTAGMRVDAAERAFASLTRLSPEKTAIGLRNTLHALHGDRTLATESLKERDHELRRKREEQLGFRFVLGMFAQTLAYNDGRSMKRWLSLDILCQASTLDRLAHVEAVTSMNLDKGLECKGLEEVWSRCTSAAAALQATFVHELMCDDYRLVPRGGRLRLVVQLLVRFPERAEAARTVDAERKVLASLVLREMLRAQRTTDEELGHLEKVRDARSWSEGVRFVREAGGDQALAEGLASFTREDGTTQSRSARLLYWLLRKEGATDFSYAENAVTLEDRKGNPILRPVALKKDVDPECQHMLPVSRIKDLVVDGGGNARGRSPVSRLGNLTWISSELNGFRRGLGSRIVALDAESQAADSVGDNLRRHVYDFSVDASSVSATTAFNELATMLDSKTKPEVFKDTYVTFCKAREDEIIARFRHWLGELEVPFSSAEALDKPNDDRPLRLLPNESIRDFENKVLELRERGDQTLTVDLLLEISIKLLRPAVASGQWALHEHTNKKDSPLLYILEGNLQRRSSSRKRDWNDSLIRIDLKGETPGLLHGELSQKSDELSGLATLIGKNSTDRLPLRDLAEHRHATLDRLDALLKEASVGPW